MYKKQTVGDGVIRLSDGVCIPNDPANSDYSEFKRLYEQDNSILLEADPIPEKTWEEKREIAYGPLKDQLGMLYHDMKDGTTTWLDMQDQVREDIPNN